MRLLRDRRFWIGVVVGSILAASLSVYGVSRVADDPEPLPLVECRDCNELRGCPICICWDDP